MSRDRYLSFALIAVFLILSLPAFWDRLGPDLTPTWFAAKFVAEGLFHKVYPDPGAVFTVTTPESWSQMAARSGHDDLIFAYIYPPIWVWLTAPLTKVIDHGTFQNAVLLINHAALIGILLLARQIAAPRVPGAAFLGLGLLILASGPYGALALFQNQPQTIVSFLTLLAIERLRARAFLVAGAVLGLATAMKVAPILLLPALLVAGDWRRVLTGFLVVGGGLGALSLILAGWQVHLDFLRMLSVISQTVILSEYSYTIDALVSQFGALDDMIYISISDATGPGTGWWVIAKSPAWRIVSILLMLGAAFLPVFAWRRGWGSLYWPAALIFLGIVSSIAWSFHFLAPIAFLPALLGRLGPIRGTIGAVLLALPGSYLILPLARDSAVLPFADQALGLIALVLTAIVFLLLSSRPDQPLRTDKPQV